MGRLIGRRLLFLLPVLFGILVVVFVTMRFVPGDPARLVAGLDAGPEELAAIRHQFGLDQPLHVQFERYLLDVLRGEFGRSLKTQRPVLDEIGPPARAGLDGAGERDCRGEASTELVVQLASH